MVMYRELKEPSEVNTMAEQMEGSQGALLMDIHGLKKPKVEPLAHRTQVEMGARQTEVIMEGRKSLVEPKGWRFEAQLETWKIVSDD